MTLFMSVKDVAGRFGVSPITVWRWAKNNPDFPEPVHLSPRCTRWRKSDIEAFEATFRSDVA